MIEHLSASDFPNCAALTSWLLEQGIDISAWNVDDAKGIENLWHEIQRGETVLSADPAKRNVRVVELQIRRDEHILTEISQQMQDGRIRERNLPPSEKLHSEETILTGARRCLQEELGVTEDSVSLQVVGSHLHVAESPSYPTLKTTYTVHVVSLELPKLPDDDFTVANLDPQDVVATHTWGWRPQSNVCHP